MADEALPGQRISTDHLAVLIEITTDAVILVDAEQRITLFNRGAEAIFGHDAGDVLGRSLNILIPERFRYQHERHFSLFLQSPDQSRMMGNRMEIRGLRRGGDEFPSEASISKVSVGGEVSAMVLLRDVSERHRALAELQQRERQLAEAQRMGRSGSWEWDVRTDRVRWSSELLRIYGHEPGATERPLEDLLDGLIPEDRERTRKAIETALETGRAFDIEARLLVPGGHLRILRSIGEVVHDGEGRVTGVIGSCQDITAQREAEDRAKDFLHEQSARIAAEGARRRMQFLAEASAELAASLDYDAALRNVARIAVPALGDWCAVHLVGTGGALREVAFAHHDPAMEARWDRLRERFPGGIRGACGVPEVIRTGQSVLLPGTAAWDGARPELITELGVRSCIVVPISASAGVLGAVTFGHDESGRQHSETDLEVAEDLARRAAAAIENGRLVRAMEEARRRIEEQSAALDAQAREAETARREAEEATQVKSQFLAVMSHELRTPLNAVIGYADLLDAEVSGTLNELQKRQLERIRMNGQHLLELVDQVLRLARIEAGREDLRIETVDVVGVARESMAMVEPLAESSGLEMRARFPPGALPIETDAGKLRQILLNLLGNAVKFTESGWVELTVEARDGSVFFHVHDTGIGIGREYMDLVFEPFEQVDRANTRRAEGTGLGLSVSRELAALLGGEITAESRLRKGSTFTLRLPAGARTDTPGVEG
jgi:PAS domain S-box-containing protein